MPRVQTIVQLNTELIERLDQHCALTGESRSSAIRAALKHWFGAAEDAEIGRQIAEGYRKFPQDLQDEWGEIGAEARRGNPGTMQRLAREEREVGLEPMKPEQ